MTNYYNSGLYMEPFFTKYKGLKIFDNGDIANEIHYDFDLFAKHYKNDLEYEDDDDLREEIHTLFWEYLSYWPTYFNPLIFNE